MIFQIFQIYKYYMIYYPLRSRLKYKHDFYKYLCENDFLTLLMINFLFLFIKNAKNDIKVRKSMIRLLKIDPKSPFLKFSLSFCIFCMHLIFHICTLIKRNVYMQSPTLNDLHMEKLNKSATTHLHITWHYLLPKFHLRTFCNQE